MYSLYPNLTTVFFWRVDWRYLCFADFKALLTDLDFISEGPFLFFSESDLRRSNLCLSVSYSDIFFFPFSLRIGRLLDFRRRECTVESPLLVDSSSACSFRLGRSFGPLNRNEIGLSPRVPKSSASSSSRFVSGSLASSSVIGLELGICEGTYHYADSSNRTTRLTWAYLGWGL